MKSLKHIIQEGGVAVMKTDTLYGLVCDAHNQHALERLYRIKNRNPLKASIVLVADYEQIESFGIAITDQIKDITETYWPGKVSIVLPSDDTSVNTHYIHKGTGGIAFRIPDDEQLRERIRDIGPLAAPSANPEGQPPAKNIHEARAYFGDQVDFYLDEGEVFNDEPSKIIKITNNIDVEIIRD